MEATPHETAVVGPPVSYLNNSQSNYIILYSVPQKYLPDFELSIMWCKWA